MVIITHVTTLITEVFVKIINLSKSNNLLLNPRHIFPRTNVCARDWPSKGIHHIQYQFNHMDTLCKGLGCFFVVFSGFQCLAISAWGVKLPFTNSQQDDSASRFFGPIFMVKAFWPGSNTLHCEGYRKTFEVGDLIVCSEFVRLSSLKTTVSFFTVIVNSSIVV